MPYIGKTTDGFGVRNRFVYLASASDTSVSGADANGATLTFTDGAYVDVYLNGVLLKSGTDYNTNTANTIAGLSALSANDEVTVIVYDVFTVADTVSATSGGTFSGGLTINDGTTITTADNDPQLTLISTDADSGVGPRINLYRNSASPADDDALAFIYAQGENDADELTDYGFIGFFADDVTDGSEDGNAYIILKKDGTSRNRVNLTSTETVFNDDSVDLDFRVESDGDANMLFVDGGNNEVGIGTNTPSGHSSPNGALLVVNSSTRPAIIQLNTTTSNSSSGIEFTDDAATGQLHYHHGSNSMVFTVNGTQHFQINSNGDLLATDTSIGSISDERLKTNIKDYTYDLEVFKKFKPKTFDWKNPKEHGDKSEVRGFTAQDILAVDDYLVSQTDIEPQAAVPNLDAEANLIPKDSDGKRLSYTSKLNGNDAMYISVIQQLIARIEALESK